MYLKSVQMTNFRKFGMEYNTVEFVDAESYEAQLKEDGRINVAPTTTLIVGKNNSGKSTVIQALIKLIKSNKFISSDFNFQYLKQLLASYSSDKDNTPSIDFKIIIGIDKHNKDLITNLIPFFTLDNVKKGELVIFAKYEVVDKVLFEDHLKTLVLPFDERTQLKRVLQLIDNEEYSLNYYNCNMQKVEGFKLGSLIEITPIAANNIHSEQCLSEAFNKIVEYRYEKVIDPTNRETIQNQISEINKALTKTVDDQHTSYINASLSKIVSKEKLQVLLSADLSFKKLMSNLIKYEYVEKGINIPENQFGLGYTNLMMILASLIDYMEKYPDTSFNSKVNLIAIEEPETYMHPQMQEVFIKNINESIATLFEGKHKNVNSQLIITTHSAHIVNSKIHSGNTFNSINYITIKNGYSKVVILDDDKIVEDNATKEEDLKFLKTHIKFKVSELFFSDAIIMVEGVSEYSLLPYYVEQKKELNKFYISVFNINGAHALVYTKLLKLLDIPVLIITDLDIKRTKGEKDKYKQISTLANRKTTNQTIKTFYHTDDLKSIPEFLKDDNIYVAYQTKVGRYFPTSFEESYILTNYDNSLLNAILKKLKPKLFKERIKTDVKNNQKNSYWWQVKLSEDKSQFSNNVLYSLIVSGEKSLPALPKYISKGLEYIEKSLSEDV
ncbi:AAA family ATPase [Agathobaculum sp. NTUH-O15-33]|uniref:ATP-dependent nuclease n=1 Tax=Agathobaculum sp. NTUH-O15-33 TaxID=3079302 RepID=UPI0029589D5D|nr:AAA family ATPase [Agathobaculum sp. NTUH-O15-33]WNX86501.1 AAA family ATPase [Agathobaculum sp. NTUH-O15-33]